MKGVIVICFFALAALAYARPNEQYTTKYDNIDLGEILDNRHLLIRYLQCILDDGKCTAEGKELKSHIGEALTNGCSKCTETQRNGSERVMKHLVKNELEYWNRLKAKYDPTGKYAAKYEKELEEAKKD